MLSLKAISGFSKIMDDEVSEFNAENVVHKFRLHLHEIRVVRFHLNRIHSGSVRLSCWVYMVWYHAGTVQFQTRLFSQVNPFGT